jgi:hypothetical protein
MRIARTPTTTTSMYLKIFKNMHMSIMKKMDEITNKALTSLETMSKNSINKR